MEAGPSSWRPWLEDVVIAVATWPMVWLLETHVDMFRLGSLQAGWLAGVALFVASISGALTLWLAPAPPAANLRTAGYLRGFATLGFAIMSYLGGFTVLYGLGLLPPIAGIAATLLVALVITSSLLATRRPDVTWRVRRGVAFPAGAAGGVLFVSMGTMLRTTGPADSPLFLVITSPFLFVFYLALVVGPRQLAGARTSWRSALAGFALVLISLVLGIQVLL